MQGFQHFNREISCVLLKQRNLPYQDVSSLCVNVLIDRLNKSIQFFGSFSSNYRMSVVYLCHVREQIKFSVVACLDSEAFTCSSNSLIERL